MYSYMQYGYINLILINLKVDFITFIDSNQATALVFKFTHLAHYLNM